MFYCMNRRKNAFKKILSAKLAADSGYAVGLTIVSYRFWND